LLSSKKNQRNLANQVTSCRQLPYFLTSRLCDRREQLGQSVDVKRKRVAAVSYEEVASKRKRLLWQIRFACHGTWNTARAGKLEGVPLSQSLNQLNGWQNQRGLRTCVTRGVTGVVDAIGKILNIWCRASRGCRCDDYDNADEILRAARISSVVQKIKSHRPSSKRNRV